MKYMLIVHYGYRIMKSLALRLALYKTCFHFAILSATGQDSQENRGLIYGTQEMRQSHLDPIRPTDWNDLFVYKKIKGQKICHRNLYCTLLFVTKTKNNVI